MKEGKNMTNKDIFTLALRIFGFYLIVRFLEGFTTIGLTLGNLSRIPEAQRFGYSLGSILPYLLLLFGGIVLIKWPALFSAGLYRKEEIKKIHEETNNISKEILQQIIYSGMGVLVIANALPHMTQIIISLTIQSQWGKTASYNTLLSVLGLIFQLVLGVYLFFNSNEAFSIKRTDQS